MEKSKSNAAPLSLSIIVPVYKEAANIQPFLQRIEAILTKTKLSYEIIFCLDPSPDDTETVIEQEIERNHHIKLLLFSRRFGQPAATMAGILYCRGESCVVIDVDLQDPPELIECMYEKLQEGYEVVYAKRKSRKGETLLKRMICYLGYKVINKLADVQIPRNAGDFRIMTRRVIEELRGLNESHGFLRGLVAYVGFKQAFIEYDRDPRFAGSGNYNRITGSLKIGLNGLVSFSSRPLQMMSVAGATIAGFSFLLAIWYVIQKFVNVNITPGLSTTILVVSFFSGVQLLCLGLMGEYVGRIYEEVKRRPMYIVDKIIDKKGNGMSLPFVLPKMTATGAVPVWQGNTFQVGTEYTKVLQYSHTAEGWNDELTFFHEESAGDQHFIDRASRDHAIYQLKQHLTTTAPVILEIGCSSGYMLQRLQSAFPHATLLGSDVVHEPLQKLAESLASVPLFRFDLTHCPLPDACVDAVVILNVLEHIEHDACALQHIFRILKPGGIVVIEVPAGPHLYDAYDKVLMHYRRYTASGLKKLIKAQGFNIIYRSHLGFFLYPGFWWVKQRNKRLLTESEALQRQQVEKVIRRTGANKLMHTLMQTELLLGHMLRYPTGIRCLLTAKKD